MPHWNDIPFEIKSLITAKYIKILISEYRLPYHENPRGERQRLISSMRIELAKFECAVPDMHNETVRLLWVISRLLKAEQLRMLKSPRTSETEQTRQATMIVTGEVEIVYYMLLSQPEATKQEWWASKGAATGSKAGA